MIKNDVVPAKGTRGKGNPVIRNLGIYFTVIL